MYQWVYGCRLWKLIMLKMKPLAALTRLFKVQTAMQLSQSCHPEICNLYGLRLWSIYSHNNEVPLEQCLRWQLRFYFNWRVIFRRQREKIYCHFLTTLFAVVLNFIVLILVWHYKLSSNASETNLRLFITYYPAERRQRYFALNLVFLTNQL